MARIADERTGIIFMFFAFQFEFTHNDSRGLRVPPQHPWLNSLFL